MIVSSKRNRLSDILFLIIIYVATITIVNPLTDFPLMDDWSYARAVQGLIEHGDWRPIGFTTASLITQSLWGTLFCVPFGFSFEALRVSTIVLAIVGILGVYILFIANNRGRFLAVMGALTLAFNPIYYVLSTTFMTDVPFTTFAILSSLFFVRCVRRFRYMDLSVACVLSIVATLCRQLGLFLPLAFAVALLAQHGLSKKWLLRAILPSMACVIALMVFQYWMSITGRTPIEYGTAVFGAAYESRGELSIRAIGSKVDTALLYLGLYCLPISVLGSTSPRLYTTNNRIFRFLPEVFASLFGLVSVYFNFDHGLLNKWVHGDIITPQGLGLQFLRGGYDRPPSSFWGVLSVLSVIGGMLLVRAVVAYLVILSQKMRTAKMSKDDIIEIFFLIAVGIYALPIMMGGFYDRYLVPLVPFLLYVISDGLPEYSVAAAIKKCASAGLIALAGVFAISGTRDYLTWNRVRWEALTQLQQTAGVGAQDVDGGFEYNGWFVYDPTYQKDPRKSWWWVKDDKFIIAFKKIAGLKVIKSYNYSNWMPPRRRTLFLLERDTLR